MRGRGIGQSGVYVGGQGIEQSGVYGGGQGMEQSGVYVGGYGNEYDGQGAPDGYSEHPGHSGFHIVVVDVEPVAEAHVVGEGIMGFWSPR